MNIDALKPFGHMAAPFQREADRCEPPADWIDKAGYLDWIDREADTIADALWPRWQPGASLRDGQWTGRASLTALELTEADLCVMQDLAGRFTRTCRQPGGLTHSFWFGEEDDLFTTSWQTRADMGLRWKKITTLQFADAFGDGGSLRFSNGTPWLLKSALQRPRAHQAAYLLGHGVPTVQLARSAWSPSAISGHAFQGLFACLNVLLVHGSDMDAQEQQELTHLAVDMGDRRVLAGVHYPSDNAMSWRVALDALKQMNGTLPMHDFIMTAVKSSIIFDAMQKSERHIACVDFVTAAF